MSNLNELVSDAAKEFAARLSSLVVKNVLSTFTDSVEGAVNGAAQSTPQAPIVRKAASGRGPGRPRGSMSAAGRKAIADAQRKRWAAFHKSNKTTAKAAPAGKDRLSPAKRARVTAGIKKYWAEKRKAAAQATA